MAKNITQVALQLKESGNSFFALTGGPFKVKQKVTVKSKASKDSWSGEVHKIFDGGKAALAKVTKEKIADDETDPSGPAEPKNDPDDLVNVEVVVGNEDPATVPAVLDD